MLGIKKEEGKKLLTTIFIEHVREAMQDAIETAAVGAAFLDPLSMRNKITSSANKRKKAKKVRNNLIFLRKLVHEPKIVNLVKLI